MSTPSEQKTSSSPEIDDAEQTVLDALVYYSQGIAIGPVSGRRRNQAIERLAWLAAKARDANQETDPLCEGCGRLATTKTFHPDDGTLWFCGDCYRPLVEDQRTEHLQEESPKC